VIGNLVSTGLIIYLTYFFTIFFSRPRPAPAPPRAAPNESAETILELRAEERKLLTTYGPGNALTKTVRIPIERATNLIVTESNQPPAAQPAAPRGEPAPAGPKPAPAPSTSKIQSGPPGASTAPPTSVAQAAPPTSGLSTSTASPGSTAIVAAPVPAPAPAAVAVSLGPSLLYRAVCQTCHDIDGKGGIGRKAMPTIPDFTDAKWHASRPDAELLHSMQEGKGQFMLPMKDKFALARTNAAEMLIMVRAFNPAGPAAAPAPAPASSAAPTAVALAPSTAARAPSAAPAPASAAAATTSATSPPQATPPPSTVSPAPQPATAASVAAAPSPLPAALPVTSATGAVPISTAGPAPSTSESPEKAAKLRVASEFFTGNCIACHGADGKGSAVRGAMAAIPDFTVPAWQTSHGNSQLSVSILEGKGVLMPPWRGKVSPELAADLVAYVRKFGPPGLVIPESSLTQFASRYRDLRKQWDEIDTMARMLAQP
jgi:mono/diheme cytochrome c family protein